MTTCTLAGLTLLLQGLGLGGIPDFPSAGPLHQPIDIFHIYLADALQQLVGCGPQQAYEAIKLVNASGNGDLVVVPKLKLSVSSGGFDGQG